MKLVEIDVAGQKHTAEIYDSEEEYQEKQKVIEKYFETVLDPFIEVSKILPRRYHILGLKS